MHDYKLNLTRRPQAEPSRSPKVARIILEDGLEVDFDARTQGSPTTVVAEGRHSTDVPTPREDELDLDGPKTHRCIIMTDRKVGLHSGELVKELGAIRWLSKDEAEFREYMKTVKVIDIRTIGEAISAEQAKAAVKAEAEASPDGPWRKVREKMQKEQADAETEEGRKAIADLSSTSKPRGRPPSKAAKESRAEEIRAKRVAALARAREAKRAKQADAQLSA